LKSLARLVCLAGLVSLGCGPEGAFLAVAALSAPRSISGIPHTYAASHPHRAEQPGLSADIREISVGPWLLVRLQLQAEKEVAVRRALLAPRAALPCREGVRESSLALDNERRWARPFAVSGSHALALGFRVGGALLQQPSSVDLVLAPVTGDGPDTCLRVPLNGPEPELAWGKTHYFASGGALRGYGLLHDVRGVGAGWSYDLRLGIPLGAFRPGFDVGLGLARCSTDCRGDSLGFFMAPLAPTLHWFVLDAGGAAVDLGLSYQFIYANVGSETQRSFWIQAPTLSMRLALTPEQGVGIESGARAGSSGLELYVSRWSSPGLQGAEQSFVFGAGWAWDATW
jgi:hypothetical protein